MPRDVSLSDSKCWNGGHEWVKDAVVPWQQDENGTEAREETEGKSADAPGGVKDEKEK